VLNAPLHSKRSFGAKGDLILVPSSRGLVSQHISAEELLISHSSGLLSMTTILKAGNYWVFLAKVWVLNGEEVIPISVTLNYAVEPKQKKDSAVFRAVSKLR